MENTLVESGGFIKTGKLQDSGARHEFDTGAVRDISKGKGRCDLLPLKVINDLISCNSCVTTSDPLYHIDNFKYSKRISDLQRAIFAFLNRTGMDFYTALLELSIHYEDGAEKYSENNWMRGMPLHYFINSGVRHYFKHLRGDSDERHDRAFIWNMVGAIWTIENLPDMDDIEIPRYTDVDLSNN